MLNHPVNLLRLKLLAGVLKARFSGCLGNVVGKSTGIRSKPIILLLRLRPAVPAVRERLIPGRIQPRVFGRNSEGIAELIRRYIVTDNSSGTGS